MSKLSRFRKHVGDAMRNGATPGEALAGALEQGDTKPLPAPGPKSPAGIMKNPDYRQPFNEEAIKKL